MECLEIFLNIILFLYYTTSLFIIGEASGFDDFFVSYDKNGKLDPDHNIGFPNYPKLIFDLIFSFIGFVSLIVIYMKTDLSGSKYTRYVIKQLTYGSLLVLFLYDFCFGVVIYGLKVHRYDEDAFVKYRDRISLAFNIIIGIIFIALSFFFKNVVIAGMNIIIYLGMLFWFFFEIPSEYRKEMNGAGEGVIDIIMIVLTVGLLVILFIKFKNDIINGY